MPTYRPRCAAVLFVPVMGAAQQKIQQVENSDLIEFPIRVRRATWESNDHQHADTLKLSAEWRDIGTDPRMLPSAIVKFYLGSANERGEWRPGPDNLRFVGALQRAQRTAREGEGFTVDLEFHDYTQFFLKTKLPQDGIPDYSQTLADAWQRICDNTGFFHPDDPTKVVSTVAQLRDRIVPVGKLAERWPPTISRAASSRFARLGVKVPMKPEADAWAVWQQCVGMCGLISFIRKDECVVIEAQDYYSDHHPPRLIWGRNILSMQESRNAELAGKGVAITSFDPVTMTTLEAFYPPRGDPRATVKVAATDKGVSSEKYEFFPYTGITDQATLDGLAYRGWEERSRQELEGQLTTAEMMVGAIGQESFDLLTLGSGDAIRVEFAEAERRDLAWLGSLDKRINYLIARGYSPGVAELMSKNVERFEGLKPEFCVRKVAATLDTDGSNGSFEVQINYCNRLQVTGDASSKQGWI